MLKMENLLQYIFLVCIFHRCHSISILSKNHTKLPDLYRDLIITVVVFSSRLWFWWIFLFGIKQRIFLFLYSNDFFFFLFFLFVFLSILLDANKKKGDLVWSHKIFSLFISFIFQFQYSNNNKKQNKPHFIGIPLEFLLYSHYR